MKPVLTLFCLLCAFAKEVGAANPPPLLMTYFIPSDKQPIPGYVERMDKVMSEVQRFYRRSMESNGYGSLTFMLDRDAASHLRVYVVRGKKQMSDYGRQSSGKIREEVKASLMAAGVNPDNHVLVIFQVLLDRQGDKTIEIGPYVGTGDNLTGTCWFYDDERLDPGKLNSKAPGGYYMYPCSLGHFNSEYIGGIAHELGHALGLPHVAGLKTTPGHSMMAVGNHHYGEELRHEGAGSYLHPASAMLLSHCRSFVGDIADARIHPKIQFRDLHSVYDSTNHKLMLNGNIICEPSTFGILAYNDDEGIQSDYDATGWISSVDRGGNFKLEIEDVKPGNFELRLQVVCKTGATHTFKLNYQVDNDGTPDLSKLNTSSPDAAERLKKLKSLYGQGLINKEDYDKKVKEIMNSL